MLERRGASQGREWKLNPILTARNEIVNFDYPPEDGQWVNNRPYQTREDAIEVFADLTETTPEHAINIFDEQKAAHANLQHCEVAFVQSVPGDSQPFLRYLKASDLWFDTIKREVALIARAVGDPYFMLILTPRTTAK